MDEANEALQSTLEQLASLLIEPSRLVIAHHSELGAGGHAEVYLATLDGSLKVAVKELRIPKTTGSRVRAAMRFARELRIWAKVQHPNILPLIGWYLSEDYGCAQLIAPFMRNGNVREYIKRTQPTTEVRLRFVRGLTLGAAYLHSLDPPISHGDIKPPNVLISDNLDAVLCDFGLGTFTGVPSGLTTSITVKGSTRYMSPEIFLDEAQHTLESDVWAWACTIFEILTDIGPYSGVLTDGRVLLAITNGTPPGSLDLLNSLAPNVDMPLQSTLDTLRHLISQCWSFDPHQRPSFSTILDLIEHGLGNHAPDLSPEESPEHLSPTQENTSTSLADLPSLDAEITSTLDPSTAAPPAGQVTEEIAQPEAPQTTPPAPSAHQEDGRRSPLTVISHESGPPLVEEPPSPERPPHTVIEVPGGPSPAGYVLEDIAEPEAPPTTPLAPFAHHQNDPHPPETVLETPIATAPPPAGYVLEDIAEPEAPATTPYEPSAQHQDDSRSIDTVLESPGGPPPAGYVLEDIVEPEAPPTPPSAPSAHRRYLAGHLGQATLAIEELEPGTLLHLQQSSAGFRRPAHLIVLDNACLVPMPPPKLINVPRKRGCLCGLFDKVTAFFQC
ncbi:hypothetical protein FS837_010601 [Tulasnella sp. UAMH 9824]|nr:hypothetical protein FS837_010601 [Tulasnella sp. UAMH 9824]